MYIYLDLLSEEEEEEEEEKMPKEVLCGCKTR